MKKLLALALALVMMLSLAACGGSDKEAPNPAVEAYFESQGDGFITSLEASFTATSNMTCKSSLEVIGDGFVIDVLIQELDNVPQETKDQMQEGYDTYNYSFASMLKLLQNECPECKYMTLNICEKDGDLLATIHVD